MFEVDKTKMQGGLEEALKHQLNLIEEAKNMNLVNQQDGRIQDYEVLSRKAAAAGVNTKQYDEHKKLLVEK